MRATNKRILCVLVAVFGFSTVSALADTDDSARSGRLGCGGTFTAQSQLSIWDIRNFSDTLPISINRMRIYDATGAMIFDSATSGLPVSLNGVLGSGDNQLEPNQTVTYNTDSMQQQGILVPGIPVPLQLLIDWSATERVAHLAGSLTRISHSLNSVFNPATGTTSQVRGQELGRAIIGCRNLPVSR
jgi:hypothetical protein